MFKKFFIGLVVLMLIAGVGAFLSLNTIVKKAIEQSGTFAMGTPVHVQSVNLSPFAGEVRISGLSIANPEGFSEPNYLTIGTIDVKASDLFGDPIVIDSILVDTTRMSFEMTEQGQNNAQVIQKGMKRPGTKTGDQSQTKTTSGKKLVIKDLKILGTQVSATLPQLGKQELTLPEIHITNLGTEEQAIEPPEAIRRVMDQVGAAMAEAKKAMIKDQIKQKLKDQLGGALGNKLEGHPGGKIEDGLKKIFGK